MYDTFECSECFRFIISLTFTENDRSLSEGVELKNSFFGRTGSLYKMLLIHVALEIKWYYFISIKEVIMYSPDMWLYHKSQKAYAT